MMKLGGNRKTDWLTKRPFLGTNLREFRYVSTKYCHIGKYRKSSEKYRKSSEKYRKSSENIGNHRQISEIIEKYRKSSENVGNFVHTNDADHQKLAPYHGDRGSKPNRSMIRPEMAGNSPLMDPWPKNGLKPVKYGPRKDPACFTSPDPNDGTTKVNVLSVLNNQCPNCPNHQWQTRWCAAPLLFLRRAVTQITMSAVCCPLC